MASIWGELKRRNVFRVAVAYVVSAWLLIQVAETVFPLFGFDDGPARIVVIVVAIGFPLTLIFSWIYELTPQGLKLERDIDRSRSDTHHTGKNLDRGIIVVLTLAVAYFAIDEFVFEPARDAAEIEAAVRSAQEQATETADPETYLKSIAVLPFANMSAEEDTTYFSDGLADTVLHMLAQIRELRVAARTSSFQFRDHALDVGRIGDQLNVGTILEGSVQRAGNRIRVTAQLIDVKSGYHLWSGNFDRNLDDVFSIQDEIANEVVSALKVSLLGEATEALKRGQTDNIDAYTEYLLGVNDLNNSAHASLASGVEHLHEAVRLDPNYAQAWSMLGLAYTRQGQYGVITLAEAIEAARDAASRGLDLDENSSAALAVLGNAERWDHNREAAEILLKRAFDIGPNDTVALEFYAQFLMTEGRFAEAGTLFRKMIRFDPLSERAHEQLTNSVSAQRQYSEASEIIEKYKSINPRSVSALTHEFYLGVNTGNWADGVQSLMQAHAIDPDDADIPVLIGRAHLVLDMPIEARQWFDRAVDINPRHAGAQGASVHLNYYLQQNDDENNRLAIELLRNRIDNHLGDRYIALLISIEHAAKTTRHDAVLEVLDNLYPHLFDDPPHNIDDDLNAAHFAGLALIQSGDVARGKHLMRIFLDLRDERDQSRDRVDPFSVTGRLILGDTDGALDKLAAGLAQDRYSWYWRRDFLQPSSMLDPIRDEPTFIELLDGAREHARQQRELLQAMDEGN